MGKSRGIGIFRALRLARACLLVNFWYSRLENWWWNIFGRS